MKRTGTFPEPPRRMFPWMRRAVTAPVAALLLLAACVPATRTGPPRVENLGVFGKSRLAFVAGQDGCTPVPLRDDLVMWTFGDTILGSWKNEVTVNATFESGATMTGMHSNTIAFTGAPAEGSMADLEFRFVNESGKAVPVLRETPAERGRNLRFWALDGILLGGRVHLYYLLMEHDPAVPAIPFAQRGVGIATWDMPPGWEPGNRVSFVRGGLVFGEGEPAFGAGVILRGEEVYAIGHRKRDGAVHAYIARARKDTILSRKTYSFLAPGGTWTADVTRAAGFFGDVMGEPSLEWHEALGKYLVVWCGFDGKIRGALFDDFAGLDGAVPRVLYEPPKLAPPPGRPFFFYYSAKEIWHSGIAVYVVYMHPGIYQPVLLRIPYSLLETP